MVLARRNPASKASYSASLFEAVNLNLTTLWNLCPSGDMSMTYAREWWSLDEPSMYNFHAGALIVLGGSTIPGSLIEGSVNSAMKFTSACPLIAIHGRYCMSNLLSSTAHFKSRPATSGFWSTCQSGWSVWTMMG